MVAKVKDNENITYPRLVGKSGSYKYEIQKGKFVGPFLEAFNYSFNFGLVKLKNQAGQIEYRYVDMDGRISEDSYDYAFPYAHGMALCKIGDLWFYRNLACELSERGFPDAISYKDGFGVVQIKLGGKDMYRDLVGNLTSRPTQLGKDLDKFIKGELSLSDMDARYFSDIAVVEFFRKENGRRCLVQLSGKFKSLDNNIWLAALQVHAKNDAIIEEKIARANLGL